MAQEQHITIHRGASYVLDVALEQADGTPLDPSGGAFVYTIAPRVGDAAVLQLEGSEVEAEESSGLWIASILLTAERTALLSPGTYYHELYFTDVAGNRSVLLYGGIGVRDSRLAYEESV